MRQPTGRFTYAYDADGRIARLVNPDGDPTSWTYDAASRVTLIRLANGTRASYAYDNANRILRLSNLGPGAVTLSSSTYKYDAASNRTRVVGADGSVTSWTYDNTDQLTADKRAGTGAYDWAYTYDGAGNRLTRLIGTALSTWTYDAANQLTAIVGRVPRRRIPTTGRETCSSTWCRARSPPTVGTTRTGCWGWRSRTV